MKIKCLAAIAAVSIFGMTALASCSDEPEVTESDLDSAAESVEGVANDAGSAIEGAAEDFDNTVDSADLCAAK